MLKRLAVVLAVLFAASVGVLFVMPTPPASSLHMEMAKAILQLGVVAVVGTIVSILVFEYQRERQNQDKQREIHRKAIEYREDLLKGTLARAMACYTQTKKVRSLLRAQALEIHSDKKLVSAEQYDKCFELLNDAQLDLGNIARDVDSSARAFSSAEPLVKNLWTMEGYLSTLITEYERNRGLIPSDTGKLPISELPELEQYIKPTSESPYKPNFVDPYHTIQLAIRKDLLYPNLPGKHDA